MTDYTLANLLAETYMALGLITHYVAEGGSTLTVINQNTGLKDANLKGTIFIINTDDNAAPQGEFKSLTKFVFSSGVFTLASALTAAVSAGDVFGYASSSFSVSQLISAINVGLNKLGDISLVDTTTLTTESSKTEYSAELVWSRKKPILIEWQGDADDTNDNDWQKIERWEYIPAAPGVKGLLEFAEQLPDGRALRIWYEDRHPLLADFDDVISATIPEPLAVAYAVEAATRWKSGRSNHRNKGALASWNESKGEIENVRRQHRIHKPKKQSRTNAIPRIINRGRRR